MRNFYFMVAVVFCLALLTTCESKADPIPVHCGLVLVNGDGASYPLPSYGPQGSLFPQAVPQAIAKPIGAGVMIPVPEAGTTMEFIQTLIMLAIGYFMNRFRPKES